MYLQNRILRYEPKWLRAFGLLWDEEGSPFCPTCKKAVVKIDREGLAYCAWCKIDMPITEKGGSYNMQDAVNRVSERLNGRKG
jgi:ribosomal protein L37AE/L43A